ncbi:MAG: alpha/beta hydrolase [Acidobacteria bacterium]|nr:alpha/beta hydrolase [Acidobacteriota bacterium]
MKKRNLALGAVGAIGGLVAWKMLTRAGDVSWDDIVHKIHHAENSHFVVVDGVRVHYQEFGHVSQPKMILVHGYTASTYVWGAVAPKLAGEGFHVIAIDLLGFGYSDKPAWFEYSIASQARVLEQFMNRLGIGRATLVGSSYGGAVAATVALDYPERVEKLVLVGAVCNDEAKTNGILRFVSMSGVGEILSPFLIDSRRFLKSRMRRTIAPSNHHLITEERLDAVSRPLRAKNAHNSVLTSARNWNASRIEADAHLINQPTLLIWGENDTIIPIHNAQRLYDSIVHSRLVVLKDCGHVPQEENPERFVELVSSFVKDKKGKPKIEEGEELRMET